MDAYVARQGKDMAREGMVGESNPSQACVVALSVCMSAHSSNHHRVYALQDAAVAPIRAGCDAATRTECGSVQTMAGLP